ncbi:MAG: MarR family transcriptional regulator [Rhodobacteraceae bacterium]|nr:MarR family transcriptional regulator [Paracoccaceae bacterium]
MRDSKLTELRFDPEKFLPHLLGQASAVGERDFLRVLRDDFGLSRTQWQIIANLGFSGSMTATEICNRSGVEKTKISRAVAVLEDDSLLTRNRSKVDRRCEYLTLTPKGDALFVVVGERAIEADQALRARIGALRARELESALRALIRKPDQPRR